MEPQKLPFTSREFFLKEKDSIVNLLGEPENSTSASARRVGVWVKRNLTKAFHKYLAALEEENSYAMGEVTKLRARQAEKAAEKTKTTAKHLKNILIFLLTGFHPSIFPTFSKWAKDLKEGFEDFILKHEESIRKNQKRFAKWRDKIGEIVEENNEKETNERLGEGWKTTSQELKRIKDGLAATARETGKQGEHEMWRTKLAMSNTRECYGAYVATLQKVARATGEQYLEAVDAADKSLKQYFEARGVMYAEVLDSKTLSEEEKDDMEEALEKLMDKKDFKEFQKMEEDAFSVFVGGSSGITTALKREDGFTITLTESNTKNSKSVRETSWELSLDGEGYNQEIGEDKLRRIQDMLGKRANEKGGMASHFRPADLLRALGFVRSNHVEEDMSEKEGIRTGIRTF